MVWNGILVGGSLSQCTIPDTPYRGVAYGHPWPLTRTTDSIEEDLQLIGLVEALFSNRFYCGRTYPLAVVTETEVIRKYVYRCQEHDIGVRLLLCGTPRSMPKMNEEVLADLLQMSEPMGYDYAYSSCDYSALADDLYKPPPELITYASRLNENGLFDTETDLQEYIAARWDFIKHAGDSFVTINGIRVRSTPLEDNGDFVPFQVCEVSRLPH